MSEKSPCGSDGSPTFSDWVTRAAFQNEKPSFPEESQKSSSCLTLKQLKRYKSWFHLLILPVISFPALTNVEAQFLPHDDIDVIFVFFKLSLYVTRSFSFTSTDLHPPSDSSISEGDVCRNIQKQTENHFHMQVQLLHEPHRPPDWQGALGMTSAERGSARSPAEKSDFAADTEEGERASTHMMHFSFSCNTWADDTVSRVTLHLGHRCHTGTRPPRAVGF